MQVPWRKHVGAMAIRSRLHGISPPVPILAVSRPPMAYIGSEREEPHMNPYETSDQLQGTNTAARTAAGRKRSDCHVRYTFDTLDLYHETSLVLGYLPLSTEINPIPIMREALHAGKRLALPWLDPKTQKLSFFEVTSISDTSSSTHGLRQPPREAKPLGASDLKDSICLVPSVEFDGTTYCWASDMAAYEHFLMTYAGDSVALVRGTPSRDDASCACAVPVDVVVDEEDIVMVGAQ